MSYNPSSSSANLLSNLDGQISADEESAIESNGQQQAPPKTSHSAPTNLGSINVQSGNGGSNDADASILSQSAHPVALIFLYLFRCGAIGESECLPCSGLRCTAVCVLTLPVNASRVCVLHKPLQPLTSSVASSLRPTSSR